MSFYFFKKFSPENDVVMADQRTKIKFTTLDGLIGYFATDNEDVGAYLKRMITENRYGISEISEEEFHRDYVEIKKKGVVVPSKHLWQREALGSGGYERGINPAAILGGSVVQAKVAVAVRSAIGTQMEEAPEDAPLAPTGEKKGPPEIKLGPRKKPKATT